MVVISLASKIKEQSKAVTGQYLESSSGTT
jgi:hypothetical protein